MEATSNNWFTNKYPIGYALSGGFIKGFAHLGVMQSLLEHDIKPNILSGVSAGALAGVFYADGNEPHKVLDYFSGHKFQDLTKLVIPKVGLFELGEFIDFLKTNLKAKTMEELQIPLIITATDLDHGRVVHFHKGNIAERVAASCCMPVLFSPVKIEGTHYVDGGVFMNLPVSTIRRVCSKVVAVNISEHFCGSLSRVTANIVPIVAAGHPAATNIVIFTVSGAGKRFIMRNTAAGINISFRKLI